MIGTVEKTLELAASPERVWRAITDPGELALWFPDRVDVDRFEPGAEGGWFWERHGRFAFRVEVIDPPARLVWSWTRDADSTLEDGVTTTVEWLLEPTSDGGTLLKLRESGFVLETDRERNDGGWDAELGELVALLTSEVGTRA